MNITAEVTIDLDEKRRVWSQVSADGEGEPGAEFVGQLAMGAAAGALEAYSQAKDRVQQTFKERPGDQEHPRGFKS